MDSAFHPRKMISEADKRMEANMLKIIAIARDFLSFVIPSVGKPDDTSIQQLLQTQMSYLL